MKLKSRSIFQCLASLAVVGSGCLVTTNRVVAEPDSIPSCEHSFRIIRTQDDNGYVNIRESSSPNSKILGTVKNGSEVVFNISDRSGRWMEITTSWRLTGWVSTQFLVYSPAGSSEYNGSLQVRTLDGSGVNIRNRPSLNSTILGTVENSAMVQYHQTLGEWFEISTPNGIRGYMARQYLMCGD
ncbi:MAG: SH3 domain-containing protein [Geitlerinemataceae cyanobacterium]